MFNNALLIGAAAQGGDSLVSVGNSALFQSANSTSLNRTFASGGNRKTWTSSIWFSRGGTNGGDNSLFTGYGNGSQAGGYYISNDTSVDTLNFYNYYSGGWTAYFVATPKFRDIGWYHIVIVWDTTQAVASERMRAYVNGKRITDFISVAYPSLNLDGFVNQAQQYCVGSLTNVSYYMDGYIAEPVFIDGTAYEPSSFGEFDSTGLYWTPLDSATIKALTFGTNGFYLDNTTNPQTDASGEGNDFTNVNTVTLSTNTPTNSSALFNPLYEFRSTLVLSNGNRTIADGGTVNEMTITTLPIPPNSGKWYFDLTWNIGSTDYDTGYLGLALETLIQNPGIDNPSTDSGQWSIGMFNPYFITRDGTYVNTTTALVHADTTMVAYDSDTGKLFFGVYDTSAGTNLWFDGTTTGTSGDPAAGSNPTVTLSATERAITLYPFAGIGNSDSQKFTVNFEDGDFARTPPTGFKALNTTNIASATTRTVSDVGEHWNNFLYTGNGTAIGSGGNALTGMGFQPDFLWIKNRDSARSPDVNDVLLTVENFLYTDGTNSIGTSAESVSAFGSDGFTVGSNLGWNESSDSLISWSAKLGGAPTATNSAGAGATPTAGSVKIDGVNLGSALAGSIAATKITSNTTLGMSATTYTGTGANATVAHGLGAAPALIIIKDLDTAVSWVVGSDGIGWTKYLHLDLTNAEATGSFAWNNTAPTSTTISLGDWGNLNTSGRDYIAYCFAPSQFISIGSYEGNGNADGALIPTVNSLGVPIQPVWAMTKSADSTSNWDIYDNKRLGYNVENAHLDANAATIESTADNLDIVTGGLKMRIATDPNVAETYVYMAIGIPIIDTDGRIIAGR